MLHYVSPLYRLMTLKPKFLLFFVFTFGFTFESFKEFGGVSQLSFNSWLLRDTKGEQALEP